MPRYCHYECVEGLFIARFTAHYLYRPAGAGFFAVWRLLYLHCRHNAAICQSPEAHPDAKRRWLAAAAAGIFYLLAGVFGGSVTGLMAALPVSWIQMLAGLALLGTISGSLYQALHNEAERDAAIVTFFGHGQRDVVGLDLHSGGWS